jgi:4-alpha-glucanotransferase
VSARPHLRALAARLGITEGYRSALDERWVETSDTTRAALVSAMGWPGDDERTAEESLHALLAEERTRPLDPERVVVWNAESARVLAPGWPEGAPTRIRYQLALGDSSDPADQAGRTRPIEGWIERGGTLSLPSLEGPGVHSLRLRLAWPGGEAEALQRLFAVPDRCIDVDERVGPAGAFGLWTQLYLARSERNWGFGNFGDLASILDWAAESGAAFVGLNPLHALASPPSSPCPYLPQSRLYRNPLYLDPECTPEWERSSAAHRVAGSLREDIEKLRRADRLDIDAVEEVLRPVQVALHAEFVRTDRDRGTPRGRAYARYRAQEGEALAQFATFRALADHLGTQGVPGDWPCWPEAFRDPESPAVDAFQRAHAEEIDFHAWVQFELDRQLAGLGDRARELGLPIGLYTDLALGSGAGGSDVWAHARLFARGVTVGAPPDAFSQAGQDWSFPPLAPGRLAEGGFSFWWRLVDGALAHAGALRLDHALGLRRLFWIPEGAPASEGAYVTYPEPDLLGLLALGSHRHGALVIGEDLGTVPEGFSDGLQEHGVLSSRVMLFERDGNGFHPARRIPRHCLVTANTHDLPPLAALQGEDDLSLRRRAGQLPDDDALAHAIEERRNDREALARRLREEGSLVGEIGQDERATEALVTATTRFLCATPAALVGLSVDDLVGEREPVNLPGVASDRHPSWTRRQRIGLERIAQSPIARAALAAVPGARRSPTTPRGEARSARSTTPK